MRSICIQRFRYLEARVTFMPTDVLHSFVELESYSYLFV